MELIPLPLSFQESVGNKPLCSVSCMYMGVHAAVHRASDNLAEETNAHKFHNDTLSCA